MSHRSIANVYESVRTYEGAGFLVQRPFPNATLNYFDPFLLLDQMGPEDLGPGMAKGAPDHPHRGFETVTYILDGDLVHKDSRGNEGHLSPGDVQWMTAGSGVVHSEMPAPSLLREGGRVHAFQLWVNLPASDKMIAPRYQDTAAEEIPVVTSDDGLVWAKVIAGEALGAAGVIETRIPVTYVHFKLAPGGSVAQPVPRSANVFTYVIGGTGRFGADGDVGTAGQMITYAPDGDDVVIEALSADDDGVDAPTEELSVLLLAGEPLDEPVARYGPFVMNTREQIIEAMEDFRAGRMGSISV